MVGKAMARDKKSLGEANDIAQLISVGVLARVCPRPLIEDTLRRHGKSGQRRLLLPGALVVYFYKYRSYQPYNPRTIAAVPDRPSPPRKNQTGNVKPRREGRSSGQPIFVLIFWLIRLARLLPQFPPELLKAALEEIIASLTGGLVSGSPIILRGFGRLQPRRYQNSRKKADLIFRPSPASSGG